MIFEQAPFLEGDTVYLRGLCPEDAEGEYPTWFNSAEVCSHNSHHRFAYTKADALAYIEGLNSDKSKLVLAIVDKQSHRHVGNVTLQNINYIDRCAEYAIVIGEKKYWGRGIATEVVRLILEHGFEELNLNRIHFATASNNIGVIKFAERVGFVQEGVRRQAFFKNGEYHDMIEFGLLKNEWRNLK
ncbi:MAG: GNAT family N-acetyltransferase [Oscillospiraceae bacterium]|nr:GNAT family N-acetyltransferase [Oscillospiraceae bacterium]